MRNIKSKVFEEFVPNVPLPKKRLFPALVAVDEKNEFGFIRRVMKMEMQDRAQPVTPQSGLDVHIGDLSFMVKHNLSIEHQPAYLTRLGRNPFEQAEFSDRLTNNFKSLITHLHAKETKEKVTSKDN